MSEETAFLEAIRESPDDDAVRLIYADWLSESRDEHAIALGELIRTQVSLETTDRWSPDWYALRRAERALLRDHQRAWEAPLVALGAYHVEYRRGLPARCEIRAVDLARRRDELVRVAPAIEALHLRVERGRSRELAEALSAAFPIRLRELDLSENQLDDADAPAIASSPRLAELEILSLSRNYFGGRAVAEILDATRPRLGLRSLDLSHNGLSSSAGLDVARSPALAKLSELDLSGNSFGESLGVLLSACDSGRMHTLRLSALLGEGDFAAAVRDVLPRSVEALDLSHNPLDDAAVHWLAARYAASRSFRRLDLARTSLGPERLRLFCESYAGESIDALSLAGDGLADQDAVRLTEWPTLATLRSLDLSSNQFSNVGAQTLANEPRLSHLCELDLHGNRIGHPGIAALRASPYLANAREQLDVSQNTPKELYRG